MRVVHICNFFIVGGIESLLLDLCSSLHKHGVESTILFLYGQDEAPKGNRDGMQVVPLKMARHARVDPRGLLRLRRILLELRPDLLHCHEYYAALAPLLLRCIGLRVPVIYTVHASIFADLQRSDFIIRHVLRWCDQVVAVAPETAASIVSFTRGLVHPLVVLNGINLSRMAPSKGFTREAKREALGIHRDSLVFLTVAALRCQKDHPTLFHAFAQARPRLGDALLLVVGDGDDRANLQTLAIHLGMQDRIVFLGKRRDVVDLLLASDIFVLSSHNEGLPISVIEACCAGLPVVATEVGSLPDLRREGLDVLLTKPGDVESLRNALLLLADPVWRESMARQLADRARAMFSIERTAQGYLSVYHQMAGRASESSA